MKGKMEATPALVPMAAASAVDALAADASNSRHPPVTARAHRWHRSRGWRHASLAAGTVRARLPPYRREAVPLRSPKTQGRAGIEPALPWPPPGVNRPVGRFNITPCSAKCRQSFASLSWCLHRFASLRALAGSQNRALCLPPPGGGARSRDCRCAQLHISALTPVGVSAEASVRRWRAHTTHTSPRPPVRCRPAGRAAGASLLAAGRHRAPVRPRGAGAPNCRSGARKGNREQPCGASRRAGLHRIAPACF